MERIGKGKGERGREKREGATDDVTEFNVTAECFFCVVSVNGN